jgi:hypothetical protein
MYDTVHKAGAKNFVACEEDFIIYVPDLLDLPVLHGNPNDFFMNILKKLGIKVWNYGNPQTGIEEPDTYRYNYGINLLAKGFSGVCDYVYQHGKCWNDFKGIDYRRHCMSYPTINKPIPTIQWEGWSEGVNDIRYLTFLKNNKGLNKSWLKEECLSNIKECRNKAINTILMINNKKNIRETLFRT